MFIYLLHQRKACLSIYCIREKHVYLFIASEKSMFIYLYIWERLAVLFIISEKSKGMPLFLLHFRKACFSYYTLEKCGYLFITF